MDKYETKKSLIDALNEEKIVVFKAPDPIFLISTCHTFYDSEYRQYYFGGNRPLKRNAMEVCIDMLVDMDITATIHPRDQTEEIKKQLVSFKPSL